MQNVQICANLSIYGRAEFESRICPGSNFTTTSTKMGPRIDTNKHELSLGAEERRLKGAEGQTKWE